jgi:hypothetical protein
VISPPLLGLGLLLGLRHALEPDHVAAVAALATRAPTGRDVLRVAASWGLGHALVILVVGTAVTAAHLQPPAWLRAHLEGLAGLVLVALGVDVLRRLRQVRSAAGDTAALVRGAARRALVVGGVHGLGGSAALLVAVAPAVGSPAAVFLCLALFGAGSIAGMGVCSMAIFLPLRAGRLARLASGVRVTVGASSVALGTWLVLRPLG